MLEKNIEFTIYNRIVPFCKKGDNPKITKCVEGLEGTLPLLN